jgi:hypothetical protein
MVLCDCDDDELAFVEGAGGDDQRVAEIVGSNDSTGDAGDVVNGEGFRLRFLDVRTEVGAGAGVGVGRGEAVAEMGESASGD